MAHLSADAREPGRRSAGACAGVRALLCAALLVSSGSCDNGDVTSRVVATVYEAPVRCVEDVCTVEESGLPATGERLDVMGVLSGGASQFDPGVYVYAGGYRANGVFFELELDVPAIVDVDTPQVVASYREYAGGAPLFLSARAGGEIRIVSLQGQDGPYAGVFDLQFTDAGPDGLLDTPDDRLRVLRIGSFTLSGHEPQQPERPEYTWPEQVEVQVDQDVVIDDPAYDYNNGCDGKPPQGYGEGTGCQGDTSTDPGSGAGCTGDTTGDVGGGSGCSGDTTGDVGGGSGCSGDSSGDLGGGGCSGDTGGGGCSGGGGSGGCTGDAGPASSASWGRPGRRPNRVLSASLPLLALLLTRSILRRR